MKKMVVIKLLSIVFMIVLVSCASNSSTDEPHNNTVNSSSALSETSAWVSSAQTSAVVQQTTQPPTSTTAITQSAITTAGPPVTSTTQSEMPAATVSTTLTTPKIILKINIQVGSKNFTATLHDNETARAIVREMPFTLKMDDFAAQEKVARLPFALPSASTQIPATIRAGDIYLWSKDNLVLFYTTFSNSYSYIPVGFMEDVSGLRDALGNASVTITFTVQ